MQHRSEGSVLPERSADGRLEYQLLDLNEAGSSILRLFNETFEVDVSWAEFRWKYFDPPFRRLDVFGAIDTSSGDLAGAFACGRREYWRAGTLVTGFQEADAAVDSRYRGRGVFAALLNHMSNFVRNEGGLFHYGFTNDLSAGAMRKAGGNVENYSNRVFALPLGAANIVESLGITGPFASVLRQLGTPVVRNVSAARIRRLQSGLTLREATEADDFPDKWAQAWSLKYSLVPRRTESYLRWRLFDAPLSHRPNLRLHWIEKRGRRVGYVATFKEDRRNALKIIDLMCAPNEVELWQCLGTVLRLAIDLEVDAVTTNVAGDAHHAAFRRCGFRALAPARCNVFSASPHFSAEADLAHPTWYLSPIDRDTFGDY